LSIYLCAASVLKAARRVCFLFLRLSFLYNNEILKNQIKLSPINNSIKFNLLLISQNCVFRLTGRKQIINVQQIFVMHFTFWKSLYNCMIKEITCFPWLTTYSKWLFYVESRRVEVLYVRTICHHIKLQYYIPRIRLWKQCIKSWVKLLPLNGVWHKYYKHPLLKPEKKYVEAGGNQTEEF
jgi:hypothetical protein